MNKQQLLKEIYDLYNHNLLCYSADYLMNAPKKEYEEKWKEQKEKIKLLDEIIADEKLREDERGLSLSKEIITRMYRDTNYYIKNSNKGTLAGTKNLEDAKRYADKFKQEYMKDKLNNKLEVFVFDKKGNKLYQAKSKQNLKEDEDTEEMD